MSDDVAIGSDLWMDAIESEERGDRDSTLRICRELVANEPDNPDAWMTIARMEACQLRLKENKRCPASCRRLSR